MRCETCGSEFELTHQCLGPPTAAGETPIPAKERLFVRYFRQGLHILGLDTSAIRKAADDPRAFRFGAFFLCLSFTVGLLVEMLRSVGPFDMAVLIGMAMGTPLVSLIPLAAFLVYFGIIHLCVRTIFRGRGRYVEFLRPMLLSSPILILAWVPLLGEILAFWWSFSVLAWVGHVVYGVARLRVRLLLLFGGIGSLILLIGVLRILNLLFGI
jgi:hypothetical protein